MSDVIVVIGAGQIGQAIARRVGVGKHVLLADLRAESAGAAADVMSDAGYDVSTATVDVSSRQGVGALVATATSKGDVTGLIHAAGVSPSQAPPATNAVTFEPGARTAWHTHPLGQVLIVTAGCGRAQRDGGPVEEIRPGDVVWFEPGEKHWHGASPTTAMTHIAIQEALDGRAVEWMEHVTDEQYGAG